MAAEVNNNVTTRLQILAAIDQIHQFTRVRLVPRTSEHDYVFIELGAGCASAVGRTGGQQILTLAANGACGVASTVCSGTTIM